MCWHLIRVCRCRLSKEGEIEVRIKLRFGDSQTTSWYSIAFKAACARRGHLSRQRICSSEAGPGSKDRERWSHARGITDGNFSNAVNQHLGLQGDRKQMKPARCY